MLLCAASSSYQASGSNRTVVLTSPLTQASERPRPTTAGFELFETVRKVLLVGVPAIFPERGGIAQLFWGLLVCFMSASFYMMAAPYIESSDDHLAQLAQLQIYLTLLSSLVLRAIPPSEAVGSMVTIILFLVPSSGVIFQTELFDDLLWLFGKLRAVFVKAFPNFHPPPPQLPQLAPDTKADESVTAATAPSIDTPEVQLTTPLNPFRHRLKNLSWTAPTRSRWTARRASGSLTRSAA